MMLCLGKSFPCQKVETMSHGTGHVTNSQIQTQKERSACCFTKGVISEQRQLENTKPNVAPINDILH